MRKEIKVHKSLNKEVSFLGLKARYIYYAAYAFIGSFFYYLSFSTAIGPIIGLLTGLGLFILSVVLILYYSKTYGENGWVKKQSYKASPKKIRMNSFTNTILCKKQLK